MISLGARYIDYGLTGGFFLFVGIALFGWYYPENAEAMWKIFQNFQKSSSAADAKALETLLNGIFASLFVVCVFATGLLLDLAGSLLVVWEADVFVKHIKRNKAWIGSLVAKYEEFLGEDMDQILTLPGLWRPQRLIAPFKIIAPFSRTESILLSHLLLTVDPTKLETVMDQVRTCRIARAVSSGLFILITVFAWIPVIKGRSADWSSLILLVGVLLSIFIVRRAYSKLCSSLFSLLFVLVRTSPSVTFVQTQESALGQ